MSQWQQVCRAGSKLVQAWDPYLMNDSLANGPPFTGPHCRSHLSFSFMTYSKKRRRRRRKNLPGFVSFIGFDWFEILKRVGFCVILNMCEFWVGGACHRRECVEEDGGVFFV